MSNSPYESIQNDTVYRYIGGTPEEGLLSCGFMRKLTAERSQLNYVIPYYSCFVLLSGSGSYSDENGFSAPLSAGSVVQRLPDFRHSTAVDGDGNWLEFYVSFGRGVAQSLSHLGLIDQSFPVMQASVTPKDIQSFEELIREMKLADDKSLFDLLIKVQMISFSLTHGHKHQRFFMQNDPIDFAVQQINASPERHLGGREIAEELHMSYENFRKQFRMRTGKSPTAYQIERRMQTAKLMLLDGSSVKEVASRLGYSDAFIFSKQFHKHTGVSPTSLRSKDNK